MSFLPYFFTEPVYVIAQPNKMHAETLKAESIQQLEVLPENAEIKPIKIPIKSKGGFAKKVLILVDEPFPEVINSTDSDFLLKILKAVQLSENDVAIVNVDSLNQDFLPLLQEEFDYRILIMFGISSPPTDAIMYSIQNKSGTKILLADSLSDIDKDKQKKLKLWENLQLLFIMK